MIKAIIIDDEPNNIEVLENLLQNYCADVEVAGTAIDAANGKKLMTHVSPDLVFLDIQMPEQNGFDLLQSLKQYDFEVIFVTAYDQYGIQAVKFAAIDYLLKPVRSEELIAAVNKVAQRVKQKKDNLLLQNLLDYVRKDKTKADHKLALTTIKETRFVKPEHIVRCEAANAYTVFYFSDGQKLTVSRPIYEYEELLEDYGFLRCHQSHLVNKAYIKSWVKEGGGYLILENQNKIPVSRGKKENVMQALLSIKK